MHLLRRDPLGVLPRYVHPNPDIGRIGRTLLFDPRHARRAERGVVAAASRALRTGEYAATVHEDPGAKVDRADAQEVVAQDDRACSSYVHQTSRSVLVPGS